MKKRLAFVFSMVLVSLTVARVALADLVDTPVPRPVPEPKPEPGFPLGIVAFAVAFVAAAVAGVVVRTLKNKR